MTFPNNCCKCKIHFCLNGSPTAVVVVIVVVVVVVGHHIVTGAGVGDAKTDACGLLQTLGSLA